MDIITLVVLMLRNVNKYEIMMGIYGLKMTYRRSVTTWERELNVYNR